MSRREDLFDKKLSLYFHDSPDKPFILLTGKSHEKRAEKISEKLDISYSRGMASDIIASSMERYFLPKGANNDEKLQVRFEKEPEYVHPLSGKRYNNLENVDHTIFMEALDSAINEISEKKFDSSYLKFLYVWRFMNEILKKHTPLEYRRYWDLTPADTRFPNHSIFDHMQVTSSIDAEVVDGINLNNMTLFLLTISPVQEYIAQARKTQDLYWGSYILSYLTWKAIEKVAETFGPDSIIFPDLIGQPLSDLWLANTSDIFKFSDDKIQELKTPTIPNRFFALLPTKDIEDIKALKLEDVIKDEFLRIGNFVLDKLIHPDDAQKEIINAQLMQFPQVYWVALPLENGSIEKSDWEMQLERIQNFIDDEELASVRELLSFVKEKGEYVPNIGNIYGVLYSFMEKIMGARKGIRNFQQFEETGRKCSICGEYNVVVYRRTIREDELVENGKGSFKLSLLRNQRAVVLDSQNDEISHKYLNQGEGLCSICFTKRAAEIYFKNILGFADIEDSFPSTAEIALLDVINKADEELKSLLQEYKKTCGAMFDCALLYKENLNEKYFRKYNYNVNLLPDLKERLKKIDEAIKNLGLNKKKYYALIKFDGDDMGQWLSGQLAPEILEMYHSKLRDKIPDSFKEKFADKKRLVTPAVHLAISKALKTFSLNYVKKIVEETNWGKVIYSGGDDVLAIVNLSSLLDVMIGLRTGFSGHINEKGRPDFSVDAGFVDYGDRVDMLMGHLATGSMGVVIAHYKEDLKDVLSAVNRAEKLAKKTDGKDSFTIHLMMHSGSEYISTAKWNYSCFSNKEGTIGVLKEIASIIDSGEVSSSFVKKLEYYLKDLDVEKLPENIFDNELNRSIMRSINQNLSDERKAEVKDKLCNLLNSLKLELGYKNFMNILSILVFLAGKGDD